MIIIALLLACTASCYAQDVIVLNNGDELKAKVEEVGSSEVKYRKFENLNGPVYTLRKSEVFMIRYESGTKDVFGKEQVSVTQSVPSRQGNELPNASFNVNMLGLLQFGPIFQYEGKIGERTYIVPYFRYAYAGVVTHLLWTGFDEGRLSPGTAAIGMGLKGFANPNGHTWYYGGFLDYHWAKANYDVGEVYETVEKGTYLSAISNIGHRWRYQNGSYLNVGIFAGTSFTLKEEERYLYSGELYSSDTGITFFAMLELSFGWDL